MDLDTLQVIFDMNTERIKPKLDQLKQTISESLGGISDTTEKETDKAGDNIDFSRITEKMGKEFEATQQKIDEFSDKVKSSLEGTDDGTKSVTKNFTKMRSSVGKDVDAMVAEIDAKMDQARAAQQRMSNLKNISGMAGNRGDYKTATKTNEQAASEQSKMVKQLNQAKDLARSMKNEYKEIPSVLEKIASQMDDNEAKINTYQRKIKALEIAEKDAMKFDSSKGFNAEPTISTEESRKIADQVAKVRAQMNKAIHTSDSLNSQYGKLEDRYGELGKAIPKVNTDFNENYTATRKVRASLSELGSSGTKAQKALKLVASAAGKMTGISYLLKRGSNGMGDMGRKARSLGSIMTSLGNRSNSSLNKMNKGIKHSDSQLKELSRGIKSLPAQFLIWGVGFAALQKLSEGFANAFKANKQFNNSMNQIKANLIAAFYPLYSTVMPWINQFMEVLSKATGWLAKFSSALFGMSNAASQAGAIKLYDGAKAAGEEGKSTSSNSNNDSVKKAIQAQNAAIQARNVAGRKQVQEENARIKARNAARRKAIQEQNSAIKSANQKRKEAVEKANAAITASNKKADDAVAAYNKKQKERIEELKKKYQDYKNNLMGFDEINTLDVSKEIPDYTPKTADHKDKEKYKPKPTVSDNGSDEALKTFNPEQTKSLNDALDTAAKKLDGVQKALRNLGPSFGGANEAAKKFRDILADLYKPMKAAWNAEGKDVINSLKYALKEIGRLLGDIGRSFLKVWDSKLGIQTLTDLLKLLADMLKLVGDIAKAFAKAWEDDGRGTKYIQSIFEALDAIFKLLDDITNSFRKAWNDGTGERIAKNLLILFTDINNMIADFADSFRAAWNEGDAGTKLFKVWLEDIAKILKDLDEVVRSFKKAWDSGNVGKKIFQELISIVTNIGKLIGAFADSFSDAWKSGNTGTKMFKSWLGAVKNVLAVLDDFVSSFTAAWKEGAVGTGIFKDIFKISGSIGETIGNLAGQFKKAWDAGKTGQSIFHTILEAVKDIADHISDMAGATAKWAKKLDFTPLLKSIEGLFKSIKGLDKTVWDALSWGYQNVLLPLGKFTITKALPAFFDLLSGAIKVINSVLKALAPLGKSLINGFLKPIAGFTGGKGIGAIEGISKALGKLSTWIDKHQKAVQTFAKILGTIFVVKTSFGALNKGAGLVEDLLTSSTKLSGKKSLLKEFFGKITGVTDLKNAVSNVKDLWGYAKNNWKGFASAISNGWQALKNWSIWGKAAAVAQKALDVVMALNPYVLIAAAIAAVVVGLVALYKHNKKFRDFVNGIYNNIKKWMGKAIDWLKKNWQDVALFIIDPVGGIANWFLKDTKTGKQIQKWGKKALKAATNWAKNVGKDISDKISSGKKWAEKAGKNVGNWVSNNVKKGSTAIKTWSKNIGKDINSKISGAKSLASKAGKTVGGWVHTGISKASTTIKSWAKGLGSTINKAVSGAKSLASKAGKTVGGWVHSGISGLNTKIKSWSKGLGSLINKASSGAKSLASKAGKTVGGWVHSGISGVNKKIQSWSKGLGSFISKHVSGSKSAASKAGKTVGGWVSKGITSVGKTISKWSGGLGGKIAKGLKNGVSAIKNAAASIANGIVGTIGKAVNGVIKGIKWILDKVGAHGASSGLSYWDVPKFATGGQHRGGLAIVNDENAEHYREAYQLPNGKQGIFPAQRNMMVNLPAGTRIKNAQQTLRETQAKLPHYAGGLFGGFDLHMPDFGDLFSGIGGAVSGAIESVEDRVKDIISGIQGIAGNIAYDATHPKEVINKGVSQFLNFGSATGIGLDIAKGGVDQIKDGAVSTVEKALKDALKKAEDKARKTAQAAYDAAKKAADSVKDSVGSIFGGGGFNIDLSGLDSLSHLHFRNGGFVNKSGMYSLSEDDTPEVILPLGQPERAMDLIQGAMKFMHTNFSGGIGIPQTMTSLNSEIPNVSTSPSEIRGGGTSGLQDALMQAISASFANQQINSNSQGNQKPIEITVKVGDETLAKHTIKGINKVNRKNGRQMLDL
ncbi:hypothetical protein OXT66_03300 [Lentilactobacillus senioris]|uniref:hypothetical protein n=1 Tax=Lentilactobacillus senioris TaxID=931534 RepID=UPI002280E8A6|nr:hypothetical protein [Lentilactobacillus senioris]MCY9806576.1 hypothetical protein [Lentilactobacillus senioris]